MAASRVHVPDYMVRGGVTYRIVTDHLGGVRLVVNTATGAVAQRIDYDAYGRVLQDSEPGFQPFGYAGGLYEPATGLVRFVARDYGAAAGRWTSKDPIGFAGGTPNLYEYSSGDPLNAFDLGGTLAACVAGAMAGLLIDGGVELLKQYSETRNSCRGEIDWSDVGLKSLRGAAVGCGLAQLAKWIKWARNSTLEMTSR